MAARTPPRGTPPRSPSLTQVPADTANGLPTGYVVDRLSSYSGSERVKVVCRVRPCLHADEQPGAVEVAEDQQNIIVNRQETTVHPQTSFNFDTVLPLDANQHEVYNAAVRDVVGDVLRGYNGTVMVYGQTGAGKTYTLGNIEPHAIGMIPRAAAEIFKRAADDAKQVYTITMAYIQIYMETIQDLLKPESDNLQLREDANGVFVAGVHEQPVTSVEQCLHYLELGERNRVFAFTHMNAHSSRSHAVVMLTVRKRSRVVTQVEKDEMAKFAKDGVTPRKIKVGKLFLVDLAGSERLKKSKSEGLRQTEAIHINKSLSTLGNCINARANNSPHVPFRESKLTRLLQESLGGNTKTSLIICISDVKQHMEETLQTLQFGSRAMCVRVKPTVNESIDYKALTDQVMSDLGDGGVNGVMDALSRAQLTEMQEQFEQEKEHFHKLIAALEKERDEDGSEKAKMTETLRHKDKELESKNKQLATHKAKLDSAEQDKQKLEKQIEDLKSQYRAASRQNEQEKSRLQASLTEAIQRLETTQAEQQAEIIKLRQQLLEKHRQLTNKHEREMQEALANCNANVKDAQAKWQQHAERQIAQKDREMKEAQAAAENNMREMRRKLEGDAAEVKQRFTSLHERYCKLQDSERKLQEEASDAVEQARELRAQLELLRSEKIEMSAEKEAHLQGLRSEKDSQIRALQRERDAAIRESEANNADCQELKEALLQLVSVANVQMRSAESQWQSALDKRDKRLTQVQSLVREVGSAYDHLQMERDGLVDKIRGLQGELDNHKETVHQQENVISEQEDKIENLQMELDDRAEQLEDKQQEIETLSAKVEVLQDELQKAHRNRLALERQLERHHDERMQTLKARSASRRQVWAALTIQRAWRHYATARLQKHLLERGSTINRLDQQKNEWQKTAAQLETKQRQALARWGADITREAVSVGLTGAVESIMAAFVLPKKELEAFVAAKNRMNQFTTVVQRSRASSTGNLSPMHAGLHRQMSSPFGPPPGRELSTTTPTSNMADQRAFRSPKSTAARIMM